MKKLSLKNINLSEIEQLSREQLKNVMGGFGFGNTETTRPPCDPDDCQCLGMITCTCDRPEDQGGPFTLGCMGTQSNCDNACG